MRATLAVLAALALPSTAAATVAVGPNYRPIEPYTTWLRQSKMPTVNVRVIPTGCPYSYPDAIAVGCAERTRIDGWWTIYTAGPDRPVFMHEMGHIMAFATLSPWERLVFVRMSRQPWHEELWADLYAGCAHYMRDTDEPWWWPGDPALYTPLCRYVRRVTAPSLRRAPAGIAARRTGRTPGPHPPS